MKIKVGNLIIGDKKNTPVQTMIKNSIKDTKKTIKKIEKLTVAGAEIIRVAIPDNEHINPLKEILKHSTVPIVADIHFDYKLAILSAEAGVDKIRINPGNIGNKQKAKKVIEAVKFHNTPVRIGINGGSLAMDLLKKYKNDHIKTMIESAKREISYFDECGYDNIVLSFKSSNVMESIAVNETANKEFKFPLHIGITEAGDITDGTVKNSAGLAILLNKGIGDTIRVSLTASEEKEIMVGKKILESLGKRNPEIEIISCPTCGRTEANIEKIISDLKAKIIHKPLKQNIKIAVMGCMVNGPGEAKNADFGVACGKEKSVLFKESKTLKTIKNTSILDELLIMVSEYYEN